MLEQEWASLVQVLEKQIRLFEENKLLLVEKIERMQKDMAALDSVEAVTNLRDQMHYYRRQSEDIGNKLKDAENHIEKQKSQIKAQGQTIDDLTRRCKELEDQAAAKDTEQSRR